MFTEIFLSLGAPWMESKDFDKFFPGWDKMIIKHPNNFEQQYPKEYQKFKNQGSGGIIRSNMNWHIDNEMDNKPLVDFVDIYLKEWIGYMEESIFEINMLSLNEKTILSLNYQKEVHNKLKSVGIEPYILDLDTDTFGIVVCIVLQLIRIGKVDVKHIYDTLMFIKIW